MKESINNINISTSTLLRALLIGVLAYLAFKLINIILIILTSIVIASFVGFGVKKIKKYIKSRVLAVFLIYTVGFSVIIGLASVFIPVFINEMSELVTSLSAYIPDGSILNSFQKNTLIGAKDVANTISSSGSIVDIIKSTQELSNSLSGGLINVFSIVFDGIFNLSLIIIISFYLSISEKGIENFFRIILPENKEEYAIDLWLRTEHKIGLWMQGQMLIGLIIGMLTYLGLTILGVKYALVLSIITAIFELIPFGIYLAIIPAIMFSYLDGGITLVLLSVGLYFIIHQFEAYLIYPLIIKKVIGISPLVIILSIIIGWQLAQFWGVILAIPFSVALFEFLDDLEKKKYQQKSLNI